MNKSYHLRSKKINTEINQSPNKINRSVSKHSLKSKQKIQISTILGKEKQNKKENNQHKNMNKVSPKNIKNIKKDKQIILDEVDAIFTQLEDFMRQAKQTIMSRIQSNISQNNTQTIQKQLHRISQQLKQNLNKITQNMTNYNMLTPKQKQPLPHSSTSTKRYIREQFTPLTPINSHQSNIQQYMRCQNTLQTTIYSQIQSQQYLPTQTDTQLLSLLVYKNKSIKINNSKRKLENHQNQLNQFSYSNNHQNYQSKVLKQSNNFNKNKNQNSFVHINNQSNKKIKKNYESMISNNSKELLKNQQQKQNREKSIYQMVLMESQRKRSSIHK